MIHYVQTLLLTYFKRVLKLMIKIILLKKIISHIEQYFCLFFFLCATCEIKSNTVFNPQIEIVYTVGLLKKRESVNKAICFKTHLIFQIYRVPHIKCSTNKFWLQKKVQAFVFRLILVLHKGRFQHRYRHKQKYIDILVYKFIKLHKFPQLLSGFKKKDTFCWKKVHFNM